MRYQDTMIRLDEQGQANYSGYRIRILHPNALQLGNLSLAWRPSSGAPTVHMINVHRGNEVINVLDGASFEILRREDQLEAASLTGILTAVLHIEDLRVGDELEVAVTTRSNDPTLGSSVSGILFLAPEPAPGRFRMNLSWDSGQQPTVQMTPDFAAVAVRTQSAISLSFDNPDRVSLPNDAPPRYRWQRILEFSDFSSWQSISARFAPLYQQASLLDPQSPLKAEARRIASEHADPLDRARAALALVQREVRYIYIGMDNANLTPATAEQTWRRRYGDCKGKTALLLALLNELGIEAAPVLVNSGGGDDGMEARLPSPGMFDHVIVRATIGGSRFWLDGTLPSVAEPSLRPILPYQWVLPVTMQGTTIERLDWQPASQPDEISLFEIDARAGFDEPATITSTTIIRGIDALRQHIQFSPLTESQLLNAMRQQLIGDTWQSIDTVQWRYDPRAQASILRISGTGSVDWDTDAQIKRLSLPGGGFSPPQRRIRPSEQDQTAPYYNTPNYSCHVTTVRLPEHTKPSDWSFNSSFDTRLFGRNYYRAFQLRDGAVSMVRGSRIEQLEISADDARRYNALISSFDNSMARISYDPTHSEDGGDAGPVVPATYEIDWSGAHVPCVGSSPDSGE